MKDALHEERENLLVPRYITILHRSGGQLRESRANMTEHYISELGQVEPRMQAK
jgi:hypothetical protein